MNWIIFLILLVAVWRFCAHFYTVPRQMAASGPQIVPATRSAHAPPIGDVYAQPRSEAIQGLVGLGYNRAYCDKPVLDAQQDLLWAGTPVTTENLLRTVMSKRAEQLRQGA